MVVPFEKKEPFLIDGASLKCDKIRRLKILRQKETFKTAFADLHCGLRRQEKDLQKIYGEQYHVRLEAALREGCEDVTSQVIKAFDMKIKPKLKDYLPKRKELIKATYQVFLTAMKILSNN